MRRVRLASRARALSAVPARAMSTRVRLGLAISKDPDDPVQGWDPEYHYGR